MKAELIPFFGTLCLGCKLGEVLDVDGCLQARLFKYILGKLFYHLDDTHVT